MDINPFRLVRGLLCISATIVLCIYLVRDLVSEAIVRVKLRKHRRRYAPGLCRGCGYDIRASPRQCPECGLAVGTPTPPPKKLL